MGSGQRSPSATKYQQSMISNSIVDSGTNSRAASKDVLTAILQSLDRMTQRSYETLCSSTGPPALGYGSGTAPTS
jgi:hypothetical protein